jgi:hypothetical protein
MGLASFAYEYQQVRSYGGGYEVRTIYVYEVDAPNFFTMSMVPVGRAEKRCGTRWVEGYA